MKPVIMMNSSKGISKLIKAVIMICMAGAAMLLLSSCANMQRKEEIKNTSAKYSVPSEKQLIVYTSHKEEVYLPIIREFEDRTGIWVEIHQGGTAQIFTEVRDISKQGGCDIVFGGGIESYKAQKDLFVPYEAEEKKVLNEKYLDADNYYTPFTELPIVFVYNKKMISYSEIPRSWKMLFDEKWRGQIAFADPDKSGTSYTIISTMEQVFNEEPDSLIPRFFDQLGGKILASSGDIIPKVADGSFLVGITLEETAKKAMEQGYDIAMVYPEDGTSTVPDGCAVVRNAPHSYNAGRFIDFVVSFDTQKYAEDKFYRRSVRTDIRDSSYRSINQIDFDLDKSARQEAQVFALWRALLGQEGE